MGKVNNLGFVFFSEFFPIISCLILVPIPNTYKVSLFPRLALWRRGFRMREVRLKDAVRSIDFLLVARRIS